MKRIFDIIVSIFLLFFLIPIYLVLAPLIKLTSKGPVIFKQRRVGRYKEIFTIYKFRSLCVDHDGSSVNSLKDPRITPVGRFIRKYKIDELPQVINVLKGDMSIIGPRPYEERIFQKLETLIPGASFRCLVKPGLSCLAQIAKWNGEGNEIFLKVNYDLDVKYVMERSFLLDLKIIFKTLSYIAKRIKVRIVS